MLPVVLRDELDLWYLEAWKPAVLTKPNAEVDLPVQTSPSIDDKYEKQKILFVVDVPNWAHDFKTNNIIHQLGDLYDFNKIYSPQFKPEHLESADLVLIYCWWQLRNDNMQKYLSLLLQNSQKILMGICSHYELDGRHRTIGMPVIKELATGVFVNNTFLYDEFKNLFEVPVFLTPNGVDTHLFYPVPRDDRDGDFTVGWAGSLNNHVDIRGYYDYIVPAVGNVEGVKMVTAARENKWRSKEQMRDFYQGLDAYICTSLLEGTPNPCLEAAACGVPILTTPVGNMPELIKPGINGYFIEREIQAISDKIRQLRDNPILMNQLRHGARREIEKWDWEIKAQNYRKMFETVVMSLNL